MWSEAPWFLLEKSFMEGIIRPITLHIDENVPLFSSNELQTLLVLTVKATAFSIYVQINWRIPRAHARIFMGWQKGEEGA